jgi:hypothetical protein
MNEKSLYCMTYNWYGHTDECWIRAANKDQAFRLYCARISVDKQKTAYSVRQYLAQGNRYEIKEVSDEKGNRGDTK